MTAYEFVSYDMMVSAAVFITVLTALLVLKVFVARQLRRLAQAGRLRTFRERGIAFAYPTRTVHVVQAAAQVIPDVMPQRVSRAAEK